MPARVVSLGRLQPAARTPGLRAPADGRQHVWRGASGRDYAHVVYRLLECPPLPVAGYVLARRDESGRLQPLHVGVGLSTAPTLNLAEVRQRAAQAGANEVHVHAGVASEAERRLIACDLRASLFGTLAPIVDAARTVR
jgi:hypothetical protein